MKLYRYSSGKMTPGGSGTHTGHKGRIRYQNGQRDKVRSQLFRGHTGTPGPALYLTPVSKDGSGGSGLPPVRVHESISATQRYCHPDCNRCIDSSIDCMIDCETKELVYAPPATARNRQPPAPPFHASRGAGVSRLTLRCRARYRTRNVTGRKTRAGTHTVHTHER